MSDAYLAIGEMCKKYDVTPRTLRFYEAKELIFPRREGQRRLYSRVEEARLKLILRGKRFGFSLEDIRQLLNLYGSDDQGAIQLRRTCEAGVERLESMKSQRDELTEAIGELEAQLAWGRNRLKELGEPVDGLLQAAE